MKLLTILLIFYHVKIVYKPLFDSENFIYKLAEKISFKPQKWRVRGLLVNTDDTLNIKESLRRIRETGIFTDIEYSKKNDTLIIKLRPLFTLALFLNLEGGGGLVQKGMGIWEHNFLGLIWDVRVNYIWGYEYPYFNFSTYYPSIFKNHDFNLYYLDSEFSKMKYISVFPYFSPYVKNRISFYYFNYINKKFFYEKGKIRDTFLFMGEEFEFNLSRNFLKPPYIFHPVFGIGQRNFYYKNFFYIKSGIQIGKIKTGIMRYVYNFGEKEFLPLGIYGGVNLYNDLKKREQGFDFYFSCFKFFKNLTFKVNFKFFDFINKLHSFQTVFYYKFLDNFVFALLFRREKVKEIENDFSFRYLGGLQGLRGYKAFYFMTNDYLISSFELRIFYKEFFNFFKPGLVLFVDNAYLFDKKEKPISYGIGLRFELTRAYDLPVMRIDVGFSEKGYYLSFGEGQSF